MKRIIHSLSLNVMLMAFLVGQSISPLEQAMTSTSLISHPEIFRDMQSNIDNELGNTKPGLQIAGLHEAIGNVRDKIIALVGEPVMSYNSTSKSIGLALNDWIVTVPVPADRAVQKVWDSMKNEIQKNTKNALDKALAALGKPKMSAALVDAITTALVNSEFSTGINVAQYEDRTGTDKLAAILAETVIGDVRMKVERALAIHGVSWDSKIDSFCQLVEEELKSMTAQLRSKLIDVLNDAENELTNGIDEVSRKLVALNTGIGITQGKGSFNGGIYASIVTQENIQLGVYLNGQLNKGDSTQPTESLVGIHFRYASDAVQYDFLGAGLFGDRNYDAFTVAEGGLGVTVRTNQDVMVGGAIYAVGKSLNSMQVTIGITIQPTRIGSASFYIGLQGRSSQDLHPVIQTSVPILPSL